MTQSTAVHPMLSKIIKATSGWVINLDGTGYRVQHGCVVFGKWYNTRSDALAELEASRARAAVQALMEPDEGMVEAGERAAWDSHNSMPAPRAIPAAYQAMLRPLVEGEGEK